ncbi:MAG: hypothetical protein ABG776_11440 [Cyanobacteria bacterium J06555_13]
MSSFFNVRTVATTLACASAALMGMVSPALAQSRTVWLNDNGATTVTGFFLQGESIYANCDEDCMDLDLYLYTEMGVLVDSDIEEDSFPIVTAPYDGNFAIEVTMPSCVHSAGCSASISSDHGF